MLRSRDRSLTARRLVRGGVVALVAMCAGPALGATPGFADTPVAAPTLFTFTGAPQSYVVPPGVTQLVVDAAGAGGAGGGGDAFGGPGGAGSVGGLVHAVVTVVPGQSLTVQVGAAGAGTRAGYPNG